jgi:hypothetical protein
LSFRVPQRKANSYHPQLEMRDLEGANEPVEEPRVEADIIMIEE